MTKSRNRTGSRAWRKRRHRPPARRSCSRRRRQQGPRGPQRSEGRRIVNQKSDPEGRSVGEINESLVYLERHLRQLLLEEDLIGVSLLPFESLRRGCRVHVPNHSPLPVRLHKTQQYFSKFSPRHHSGKDVRRFGEYPPWSAASTTSFRLQHQEKVLTDDCSAGALPDPESSDNPEPNCVLPVDNKIDFAGLEGLKVVKPQKDRFVLTVGYGVVVLAFRPTKRCLPPAEGLLRNNQITSVSRLKALSRRGTTVIETQASFEGVVAGSVFRCSTAMEKTGEVELFADRARVRDDPGMRARSRRTILKSSSIAKNCLRSSSTWTSGVHRDKESLPNAKV